MYYKIYLRYTPGTFIVPGVISDYVPDVYLGYNLGVPKVYRMSEIRPI